MSLKRKHSDSVVDLTASPPLPLPLTARPLALRSDSPASSTSSRATKRRKRDLLVVDLDVPQEATQPPAGPSKSHHGSIEVEPEAKNWQLEDDDELDSDIPLAVLTKLPPRQDKNAVAGPSKPSVTRVPLPVASRSSTPPPSNLLSSHTCPICLSTVTNACLTPCGHVLCGACLFASVKSGIQRSLAMGIPIGGEGTAAKCPVCRAVLKGWDGKGGGIIPLKIRTIVAL